MDGTHIWVARCRGTVAGVAAYAERKNAETWAESAIGSGGEWTERGSKHVYEKGADKVIVELTQIPDVVGLVIPDPPAVDP